MAYLADDEKLKQDQNAAGGATVDPATQNLGSAGSAVVSGGATGSTGVSTAGVGSGGTGGWTNIQSYLNANQGNTSSSKLLADTTNKEFDTEANNLKTTSDEAKQKSQDEVGRVKVGQDEASKLLSQAAGQYNYKGDQNDAYKNITQGFSSKLNDSYKGPTDYNYALGANAQNYGTGLQTEEGTQGVLDSLYKNATGGLSSGQLNLQHQLDLDPTAGAALSTARQNALNRYSGLMGDVGTANQTTQDAIKAAQSGFGDAQKQLRDYFSSTGDKSMASLNQGVQDHNAYNQNLYSDFTNERAGYKAPQPYDRSKLPPEIAKLTQPNIDAWVKNQENATRHGFVENGTLSDGTPWDQQGTQDDFYGNGTSRFTSGDLASLSNVADEKNNRGYWNTIQDIFGQNNKINADAAIARKALLQRSYAPSIGTGQGVSGGYGSIKGVIGI